jgi:chemotaxis protein methyltransferase CheR
VNDIYRYDWAWFIKRFEAVSSINLTAYKRPQMERRINSFMRNNGLADYFELIQRLQSDKGTYKRFLEHLTINVSEFFRNPLHWRVLEDTIIPLLIKSGNRLKIWSAGCSSGEEAFSLAIMSREKRTELREPILATDLDSDVLERASQGVYRRRQVQDLPEWLIKKYFEEDKGLFKVRTELRSLVRFKQHDLLKDPFTRDYDLILCRNVVIYFTEETKQELYGRFAKALRPGGVLFIGGTEQIFNSRELGFVPISTFFYQKI